MEIVHPDCIGVGMVSLGHGRAILILAALAGRPAFTFSQVYL